MAILSHDEFMSRIQARVGEDNSDDALSFIEDMRDTYDDLNGRANNPDPENWKEKYELNDAEWREKYRKAFFETPAHEPNKPRDNEIKITDLFTEVNNGN